MTDQHKQKTLYEYVQYKAALQGLSLNELALKSEGVITSPTLYNLKHRKPRAKTYAILSEKLDVPISDLIDLPIKHS